MAFGADVDVTMFYSYFENTSSSQAEGVVSAVFVNGNGAHALGLQWRHEARGQEEGGVQLRPALVVEPA